MGIDKAQKYQKFNSLTIIKCEFNTNNINQIAIDIKKKTSPKKHILRFRVFIGVYKQFHKEEDQLDKLFEEYKKMNRF